MRSKHADVVETRNPTWVEGGWKGVGKVGGGEKTLPAFRVLDRFTHQLKSAFQACEPSVPGRRGRPSLMRACGPFETQARCGPGVHRRVTVARTHIFHRREYGRWGALYHRASGERVSSRICESTMATATQGVEGEEDSHAGVPGIRHLLGMEMMSAVVQGCHSRLRPPGRGVKRAVEFVPDTR